MLISAMFPRYKSIELFGGFQVNWWLSKLIRNKMKCKDFSKVRSCMSRTVKCRVAESWDSLYSFLLAHGITVQIEREKGQNITARSIKYSPSTRCYAFSYYCYWNYFLSPICTVIPFILLSFCLIFSLSPPSLANSLPSDSCQSVLWIWFLL